jgi:hypothetical protein
MSGKLITASIDVMKIEKSRLITGKKGTYLNLTIWVNDKEDQFGNDVSIEQRTDKGQTKIYLGNGKTYKPKEERLENKEGEWVGKKEVKPMSDISELPGSENDNGGLPF